MAVYKRNNVWYIDYYIKVNGKRERRREPVSQRRDEAETRLKKYLEMVKAGKDPKTTVELFKHECYGLKLYEFMVPKLTQFVPTFLKLHGYYKSKKTQESYKNSLNHLLPAFGEKRLNTITKVMVKSYMANRGNEGASNSTINNEIACLKCILSRAVEWDYIEKNPLLGLKKLQEPPPIVRYLTSDPRIEFFTN